MYLSKLFSMCRCVFSVIEVNYIEDHSQYIDLLGYKMVMRYRTIASEEFLTIRKITYIILKRSNKKLTLNIKYFQCTADVQCIKMHFSA